MTEHGHQDSHTNWLQDVEYRGDFGSENAKLEVAVALATARKAADITQAGLAELAGVSQAYIAKLERGDANPSIGNIGRLLACVWFMPSINLARIQRQNPAESVALEKLEAPDSWDLNVSYSDNILTGVDSIRLETYKPEFV